jgi:hypothetical protein
LDAHSAPPHRRELAPNFLSALVLTDSSQVSMIDSVFFDKLVSVCLDVTYHHALILALQEYIARQVRRNERPFGGIQVNFSSLAFSPTSNFVHIACRLRRLLPVTSHPRKELSSFFRLPGTLVVSVFWGSRHSSSCLSPRQQR